MWSLVKTGLLCSWLDEVSCFPVSLVRADLLGDMLALGSGGKHAITATGLGGNADEKNKGAQAEQDRQVGEGKLTCIVQDTQV